MDKLFFVAILVLLIGCDVQIDSQPDWKRAIFERGCDEAQFERVKAEADYCNATTDYFGSVCLGAAMIRNCPVKEQADEG